MIKLLKLGKYKLIETKNNTKVLILDEKDEFAWINAEGIGEILVTIHEREKTDSVLSIGDYHLFDVKDEENLIDLPHLQLEVGDDQWQGYLLTNGLPNEKEKRHRIIPTDEIVKQ